MDFFKLKNLAKKNELRIDNYKDKVLFLNSEKNKLKQKFR